MMTRSYVIFLFAITFLSAFLAVKIVNSFLMHRGGSDRTEGPTPLIYGSLFAGKNISSCALDSINSLVEHFSITLDADRVWNIIQEGNVNFGFTKMTSLHNALECSSLKVSRFNINRSELLQIAQQLDVEHAIILHLESISSGHYIAFGRNLDGWYFIRDQDTTLYSAEPLSLLEKYLVNFSGHILIVYPRAPNDSRNVATAISDYHPAKSADIDSIDSAFEYGSDNIQRQEPLFSRINGLEMPNFVQIDLSSEDSKHLIELPLKNVEDKPITISRVVGSCGCFRGVDVDLPITLLPNENITIGLNFDTKNISVNKTFETNVVILSPSDEIWQLPIVAESLSSPDNPFTLSAKISRGIVNGSSSWRFLLLQQQTSHAFPARPKAITIDSHVNATAHISDPHDVSLNGRTFWAREVMLDANSLDPGQNTISFTIQFHEDHFPPVQFIATAYSID